MPNFFDPHSEYQTARRNLPHWQQEAVTYFVTFHLGDSLPVEKLAALIRSHSIELSEVQRIIIAFRSTSALTRRLWRRAGVRVHADREDRIGYQLQDAYPV